MVTDLIDVGWEWGMLRSGRLGNTVETASFTARGHLEKEKKVKVSTMVLMFGLLSLRQ